MKTRFNFHGLHFEMNREMAVNATIEGSNYVMRTTMEGPKLVDVDEAQFRREVAVINTDQGPIFLLSSPNS